jgi:hypothetical protein
MKVKEWCDDLLSYSPTSRPERRKIVKLLQCADAVVEAELHESFTTYKEALKAYEQAKRKAGLE